MDENPLLERLIDDAEAEGYMFLTDQVKINVVSVIGDLGWEMRRRMG